MVQAKGPELVLVSRIAVFVWACIMGAAICIFQSAGVNVYWLTIWNGIICAGGLCCCRQSSGRLLLLHFKVWKYC